MVQSIVYIPTDYVSIYYDNPNSPYYYDYTGIYIPWYPSYDILTLYYYVTPVSMASIIAQNYGKSIMAKLYISYPNQNSGPNVLSGNVRSIAAPQDGIIQVTFDNTILRQEQYSGFTAIALYVKDTRYTDGTDYMTTFTPVKQMAYSVYY